MGEGVVEVSLEGGRGGSRRSVWRKYIHSSVAQGRNYRYNILKLLRILAYQKMGVLLINKYKNGRAHARENYLIRRPPSINDSAPTFEPFH